MSHTIVNLIRRLPIKNPAKAVLWVIADIADDKGYAYPSIDTIAEETGCSRSTVIRAIATLESCGVVVANRENGRHTTYTVTPESYSGQCQSDTSVTVIPASDRHPTSVRVTPYQCQSDTIPVSERHTNPHKPPYNPQLTPSVYACEEIERPVQNSKPKVAAHKLLTDLGCDDQIAADFIAHRKAKKAAITPTALNLIVGQAERAGISFERAIEITIARNWVSFNASWKWQDDLPKAESANKWDVFLNQNKPVERTVSGANLIPFGGVING